MISSKKLINMARKWKKLAAVGRKRITFPKIDSDGTFDSDGCTASKVDKGHFVVYTADKKRHVFPLVYLSNEIFKELLKMAEEEFGHQSDGPLTLPCDSVFLDYAVSLMRRQISKDLENALLMSITSDRCVSASYLQQELQHLQLLICTF